MTLLEDLQALDVSIVVDAKVDINVAIDVDVLQNIIGDGAIQQILGDLGTLVAQVTSGEFDAASLLDPLLAAFAELPSVLGLDDLPIAEYVEAVSLGAEIIAALLAALNNDLSPVADLIGEAGGAIGEFTTTTLGEVGEFQELVLRVEAGLPTDPIELGDLAIELLLPFPTDALLQIRGHVDSMLGGLAAINLDGNPFDGLIALFAEIEAAGRAGDVAAVDLLIPRLDRLGLEAVTSMGGQLRSVSSSLSSLRLDLSLQAVASLGDSIRSIEPDGIAFLDLFRGFVVEMRAFVDEITPELLLEQIGGLLDLVEDAGSTRLDEALDAQIERLSSWLRGLFAELGLADLRAQVSDAIHGAAQAIVDANLDGPANQARALIEPLHELVSGADLAATVGEAKAEIVGALDGAFTQVEGAVGAITDRIAALATDAAEVLQRGADGLAAFRVALDAVEASIGGLGIEELTTEVIDELRELREAAVALVGSVPLPEQLKPVVDQLIETVDSIDINATLRDPLLAAAEQIALPADVAIEVQATLGEVATIVQSLIPDAVLADLEASMNDLIAKVGELDIAPLTAGVSDLLDQLAGTLDDFNLADAAEPASAAFEQVIDALGKAHPRLLLAPVINAYDTALGSVPVPDPETMNRRVAQVSGSAGEAIARAAAAPIQRLAPSGSEVAPSTPAGESPGTQTGTPPPPLESEFRAGDLVRVIGYFPAKLHEAVESLPTEVVQQVVERIDQLCGQLGRDLRLVGDSIGTATGRVRSQFEAQLGELATAQVGAQLGLRAGFGGLDVDAELSVAAVGSVSAGTLRAQLAADLTALDRQVTVSTGATTGDASAGIDRLCKQLEGCALSPVGANVDALLEALDVEPLAVEIDELVAAMLNRAPELLFAVEAQFAELDRRFKGLVEEFNPATLAQRLLVVLDVFKEQMDLLNPSRLADELGEIHASIVGVVRAYDPALIVAEIDALVSEVATLARGLDPAALIGDFAEIEAQLLRLPALLPIEEIRAVGAPLESVGAELLAIDVEAMFVAINALAPEVVEALTALATALQVEIRTLLESVRYAQTSGSASVSVSVSGSIG